MIVSHEIKTFRHHGLVLDEALWINGTPHFTRDAIAKLLELKEGSEGVDKIVRRHPFIKRFSKVITVLNEEIIKQKDCCDCTPAKLAGRCPLKDPEIIDIIKKKGIGGGTNSLKCLEKLAPKTRIRKIDITLYHPMGLQLIMMKSTTPKAQKYQIFVARLICGLIERDVFEPSTEQIEAEKILEMAINSDHGQKRYYINEYQKKIGCCKATAFNHLNLLKKGEHPGERKKKSPHKNVLIQGDLELKIRMMVIENPSLGYRSIYNKLGRPKSPSFTTVRNFLRGLKAEKSE